MAENIDINNRGVIGILIKENFNKMHKDLSPIYSRYFSAYTNLKIFTLFKRNLKYSINEVLKIVGLEKYKKTRIIKYSEEMKEKVNIASNLLLNDSPIELIEPTKGLDEQGKIEIKNLINEVSFQYNKEFIIYSRNIDELKLICTNITIL